ncbi:MAG: class I SAM-dependent methyltransferase [Luminiphilus sp.]|nr:class I SAM-dependent methyltransferase [Luminiphilus sp.]
MHSQRLMLGGLTGYTKHMEGFSQAAENNKTPILEVLKDWLKPNACILEIGSGSGQHAIHFSEALPSVRWQPSDRPEVQSLLQRNTQQYGSSNLLAPITLDLAAPGWPDTTIDAVYSANVLHIVSTDQGEIMVNGAAQCLLTGGLLFLYGPFRYQGSFTTPSNADFDAWLRARDPKSGIRDFEWLNELARSERLVLQEDRSMPANNQCLVFQKQ